MTKINSITACPHGFIYAGAKWARHRGLDSIILISVICNSISFDVNTVKGDCDYNQISGNLLFEKLRIQLTKYLRELCNTLQHNTEYSFSGRKRFLIRSINGNLQK